MDRCFKYTKKFAEERNKLGNLGLKNLTTVY